MGRVYGGPAKPSIPVKMDDVDYKPKTEPPPTGGKRTERLDAARSEDIARAAQILREGGTVAFPTETVYGLGANALDPVAIAKIFAAKQRPHWDPLIVHISDPEMLSQVAIIGKDIAARAGTLMGKFWPGPLTLLLPRTAIIPDAVTAARPLVGVRIPSHPVALELIRQAGVPIAAPSANRFGHTSPTTAAHVLADLDGRIDAILDGGPTQVGLESTVLDPTQWPMLIYRQGATSLEQIESLLGQGATLIFTPEPSRAEFTSLPSPGVGIRHYAPKARLVLIQQPDEASEIFDLLADNLWEDSGTVGVLLPDGWPSPNHGITFPWGDWQNPEALAHNLYEGLRTLDDQGATVIIAPIPNGPGIAAAIRDRLEKAARP